VSLSHNSCEKSSFEKARLKAHFPPNNYQLVNQMNININYAASILEALSIALGLAARPQPANKTR